MVSMVNHINLPPVSEMMAVLCIQDRESNLEISYQLKGGRRRKESIFVYGALLYLESQTANPDTIY